MKQLTDTLNLASIEAMFDEHAARTATYKGRDLTEAERVHLCREALTTVFSGDLKRFRSAMREARDQINSGESVGRAVANSIKKVKG